MSRALPVIALGPRGEHARVLPLSLAPVEASAESPWTDPRTAGPAESSVRRDPRRRRRARGASKKSRNFFAGAARRGVRYYLLGYSIEILVRRSLARVRDPARSTAGALRSAGRGHNRDGHADGAMPGTASLSAEGPVGPVRCNNTAGLQVLLRCCDPPRPPAFMAWQYM